ncbi:hypothetical protein IFM89_018201 [Coptis chinensis]|uniref:Uncharacterized protein n=1 Tax=Coptis chinensis TaxID=261450 RepID=A0A835I4B7_9MAGN|nr:hypothetical protein IFM89_018201 [Coptis chinensis]
MKPSAFSDVEHWYRSTMRSVRSTPPLDSENFKQTDLLRVYKRVFHGFAAELTSQEAELLKTRPEVLAVYPNEMLQLHTTRSPHFLGLMNSNHVPTPKGLFRDSDYGSGVVIGVLDTGVWPERESYNDNGLDSVPSHWKGECVEGQNFTRAHCNKKLVGARFFANGLSPDETKGYSSARDSEGHGTHTSSTAAGSEVANASLFGYARGIASGIAPKARIAVYKVCWPSGCTSVDIVAAYDKAVEDGVDIISFSIGGNVGPYYLDPIAIAQFGALEHNVLVSASAGNDGPTEGTVCNIPPWVTTIAAGTIDRRFPANLVLEDGTVFPGVSLYGGPALPKKRYVPLVYGGNVSINGSGVSSGALCMPGHLDPKLVSGKIIVCERGVIARALKGEVVKDAGGVGMVLANVDSLGESLIADAHVLPTVAIPVSSANKVLSYLASSQFPVRATIVFRETELNVHPAPVVAGFSSRGPNTMSDYVIKPDLTAPGVDILAAWTDDVGPTGLPSDTRRTKFNIMSGTSMACPHISGVAALLKGAHRDWSPSRIKSAMMTTSYVVDNAGNQLLDEMTYKVSKVWDYGSGHVDPEKAVDPGLVYDLTVDDYIDFLCASNYDQKEITLITRRSVTCKKGLKAWDLNYPSIGIAFNRTRTQRYEKTVTRTVTHVSEGASSYTVKVENPPNVVITVVPPKLEFSKKDDKLNYVVKISAKKFDLPDIGRKSVFGRITWQDGRHVVSMPIAVTQFSL